MPELLKPSCIEKSCTSICRLYSGEVASLCQAKGKFPMKEQLTEGAPPHDSCGYDLCPKGQLVTPFEILGEAAMEGTGKIQIIENLIVFLSKKIRAVSLVPPNDKNSNYFYLPTDLDLIPYFKTGKIDKETIEALKASKWFPIDQANITQEIAEGWTEYSPPFGMSIQELIQYIRICAWKLIISKHISTTDCSPSIIKHIIENEREKTDRALTKHPFANAHLNATMNYPYYNATKNTPYPIIIQSPPQN